jgi:hypothetical protein
VLQPMQRMGYPKQRRKEGLCVERHAWPCDHLSIVLCNLLHAYRDAYLVMDGLYKLGVPTPDAMPLLLAIMSHLMDGLDIRPRKPALHANIISTPPSQLIKLAVALKVPNCLLYALHIDACLHDFCAHPSCCTRTSCSVPCFRNRVVFCPSLICVLICAVTGSSTTFA